MAFSVSKKLPNITIDVVFIMKYNSSHKKKECVCVATQGNLILTKHNKSTQNSRLDTEKMCVYTSQIKDFTLAWLLYLFIL